MHIDLLSIIGGECQPGYSCPEGSDSPQACIEGHYCATPGLSNYTGPCNPGYYCKGGSSTAQPTDGIVGNLCPAGYYCPLRTTDPIGCPNGTYSNATGTSLKTC